jgi:hypothetical protein
MQRDRERVERLSQALGPDLLTDFVEEFSAISQNVSRPRDVLREVGKRASNAGIPPEDLLIATKELTRDIARYGTAEQQRLEHRWHEAVRKLIAGYYSAMFPAEEQ